MNEHETRPSIEAAADESAGQWARDLLLLAGLLLAMVLIAATAPSHTYRWAQFFQVGASIDVLETGRWLLPHNQVGIFPKSPLQAWLLAPVLAATDLYEDWVFRLPTIAAALALTVLVYAFGRRWYNRRVALLAGALWATSLHMGKLVYLARTDMLLALWIVLAVFCLDRLLWHRAAPDRQGRWAVGFWASMILAAMTKGWGVVNIPVIGLMALLVVLLRRPYRQGRNHLRQIGLRLRQAARRARLAWGLVAFAAVMVPLMAATVQAGGEQFGQVVYFEVFQRITGMGSQPPDEASLPVAFYLLYWQLPVSIFALAALVLVGGDAAGATQPPPSSFRSRLRASLGPVLLPLCWIVAVFVPFQLSHGFRPDYLLPCYPAMALLAAWGLDRVASSAPKQSLARRAAWGLQVAVGVVLAVTVTIAAVGYLWREHLPEALADVLEPPWTMAGYRPAMLAVLIAVGLASLVGACIAALRWRVGQLAGVTMVLMLGINALATHMTNPAARTGDGEKIVAFNRRSRRIIGDDPYGVYRMDKMGAEVYMGRWARLDLDEAADPRAGAERADVPWLITCDRGLVEMGLSLGPLDELDVEAVRRRLSEAGIDPASVALAGDAEEARARIRRRAYRCRHGQRAGLHVVLPEMLGQVVVTGRPVRSQRWGRAYLIRLGDR